MNGTAAQKTDIKTARLYRMVMPGHICPYGLKAKHLLERKGFTVDDHWLETRAQTDAFKAEHGVKTTPQTFIDGRRIGGYDDLRRHFGLAVRDPGATSYTPVIALFAMTALMALAAARQGKYDAFHHAMFAASSLDPSAIAAAAQRAGVVTDGSADATANEALFQRELDANLAIATQLQLNATPTWVVGDQLFQGQVGYDALKRAIAKARSKS